MKKAFTMIELVFVLVVIGILAATIIPRMRTNPLQEAAIQVLSHIRYTQHLAMIDDKFDASDTNWYKKRWQIVFSNAVTPNSTVAYTIFADTATAATSTYSGDADISEIAKNPENTLKLLTGGYGSSISSNHSQVTKKLNLELSYGITSVEFNDGCDQGLRIAFDYLGRPMKGDLSGNASAYENDNLIRRDCTVKLIDGIESISIKVEQETGFACILSSSGSECI